jgi:hypothetical protein
MVAKSGNVKVTLVVVLNALLKRELWHLLWLSMVLALIELFL